MDNQNTTLLPPKWVVLRNRGNAKIINKWLNDGLGYRGYITENECYVHYPYWEYKGGVGESLFNGGSHTGPSINHGYTEITFEEFLKFINMEQQFKPKRGDLIEVLDNVSTEWSKRIFLSRIEGAVKEWICVHLSDKANFNQGKKFEITFWEHAREIVLNPIKVVLNSEYTAIVDDKTIEVGCQKIPISVLDELVKARDSYLAQMK